MLVMITAILICVPVTPLALLVGGTHPWVPLLEPAWVTPSVAPPPVPPSPADAPLGPVATFAAPPATCAAATAVVVAVLDAAASRLADGPADTSLFVDDVLELPGTSSQA